MSLIDKPKPKKRGGRPQQNAGGEFSTDASGEAEDMGIKKPENTP